MLVLFVILVTIKLYARINIFNDRLSTYPLGHSHSHNLQSKHSFQKQFSCAFYILLVLTGTTLDQLLNV